MFAGDRILITISMGVTMNPDGRVNDVDSFDSVTDAARNEANHGGRNRVVARLPLTTG